MQRFVDDRRSAMTLTAIRKLRCALLALCACIALGACSRGGDWQELEVTEGGFKVLMRPHPTYMRQALDTPVGKVQAHVYSSDRPDAYFAVGYNDYPLAQMIGSSPDTLFTGVRDTWVKRINGRLTGSSPMRLQGAYPGLGFSAEGRVKDADTFLEGRLYLADQRLYQVIAMGRKGEIAQGTLNRFLESFRIVPIGDATTIEVKPPAEK